MDNDVPILILNVKQTNLTFKNVYQQVIFFQETIYEIEISRTINNGLIRRSHEN
jgi:hypothetical protein